MKRILLFLLLAGTVSAATLDVDPVTGVIRSPSGTLFKSGNGFGLVANPLSQFAATTSLQLLGNITDETGTGSLVFGTAPTFTTSIVAPLVIGGTGTTSTLTLKATSGVGTTNSDIIFLVGNNGATEAARMMSTGRFGVGTNSPSLKAHFVSEDNASFNGIRIQPNNLSQTLDLGWQGLSGSGDFTIRSGGSTIFNFGGTQQAVKTSAGNWGIMTSAPDRPLEVNSATGLGARFTYNDSNGGATNYFDVQVTSGGNGSLVPSGGAVAVTGSLTSTVTGATDSLAGTIESSTTAEAEAMANNTTAMSPADVASAINYTTSVNITADNQVVTVGTARTIQVTSDSSTAASRSFSLSAPSANGIELTLVWNSFGSDKGELTGLNTLMRQPTYTFNTVGDMLHFKSGGGLWVLIGVARGDDLYSTSEAVCGMWIDGTTLYRKTVNVGTLPNTTSSNDAHGISGGTFGATSFKRIYGYAQNGSATRAIPCESVTLQADATNITIITAVDYSAYSGYVTLEYTK